MPISGGADQANMANSLKQAVEEPVLKFKSEVIHHKSASDGNPNNSENAAPSSEIIEGTITKDAIILEQELSNELRDLQNRGTEEDNGQ